VELLFESDALAKLLKDEKAFEITPEVRETFESLKDMICCAPVLRLPRAPQFEVRTLMLRR